MPRFSEGEKSLLFHQSSTKSSHHEPPTPVKKLPIWVHFIYNICQDFQGDIEEHLLLHQYTTKSTLGNLPIWVHYLEMCQDFPGMVKIYCYISIAPTPPPPPPPPQEIRQDFLGIAQIYCSISVAPDPPPPPPRKYAKIC